MIFLGADRTIPIEDRVESAVKIVQKLTTTTKATVVQTGRGGYSTVKRGGAGRRGGSNFNGGRQDYKRQNYYSDYHILISTMTDPTMEPPAAMETTTMTETANRVLVSFVAQLGIRPSTALKLKHQCFSFPGRMC